MSQLASSGESEPRQCPSRLDIETLVEFVRKTPATIGYMTPSLRSVPPLAAYVTRRTKLCPRR